MIACQKLNGYLSSFAQLFTKPQRKNFKDDSLIEEFGKQMEGVGKHYQNNFRFVTRMKSNRNIFYKAKKYKLPDWFTYTDMVIAEIEGWNKKLTIVKSEFGQIYHSRVA